MTTTTTSSFKRVRFSGIAIKLYAIVALAMAGILGLLALSLFNSYSDLMATKRSELHHLVDTAISTVSALDKKARSGQISEQVAKEQAKQIISEMRYQGQNYFWINDTTPKMVMHPLKPQLNGKDLANIKDPNGIEIFTEFVKATKINGEGYVNYMWPKPGLDAPQPKIAFVKEFKPWGWIIGSGAYIDDIEELFWYNAKSLFLISASIFMFILGASLMLARSINKPMRQITNNMLSLADGNLEVEIPVSNRQDEIGHMEKALQVFRENALERRLLAKRQEEQKSENERHQKAALLEMADDFDNQVRTIVTSVSSASEQLGLVTKEMAECTSENKLRVGAITVSMETTNSNVEKVSEASQEMSSSITEISSQMTVSNKVTQSAVEEVKRANVVIEGLSEASEAIGNIVKLIQEIAEQTNLLALNATIEAARAGDAGKGFAVVASEVKGLASQTGKATEEIAGQIDTIQSSISEAVIAIDQIDTTIYKLNDISHSIAAAVEEQGYAAGEISSNIVEAAQATKDVFDNTNALNSLADQNGTSADTMTKSALELNNQINDLGSQVDVFVNNIRSQNKLA